MPFARRTRRTRGGGGCADHAANVTDPFTLAQQGGRRRRHRRKHTAKKHHKKHHKKHPKKKRSRRRRRTRRY